MSDFPFDEVAAEAAEKITMGFDIHQKFTCAGCGQRLTMADKNIFYMQGTCDQCPTVTDIKKQGCNYLLISKLVGGRR
jgi:hypothetical protein